MLATRIATAVCILALGWTTSVALAQSGCPLSYGSLESSKPNKLYLYFPAVDDNTYPEFGLGGLTTRPAHRFDAADLTSYLGTTVDLRNRVTDVVAATYCEFNVQVLQTTTTPPTTAARRNTVAIGTDAAGPCGNETWGLAQAVDAGDPTAVDFARVWAGSYQLCAGGPGGQLSGTNSTLDRWARSIGGTAAHEGGHNYGLAHSDGLILASGEDALTHHIMASGSHFSYADRAGYRRHFSDHEYSILASNVGLSIQTMWNWDLVNPNAATGVRLQMDFLSAQPSLVLSWAYGGPMSPWLNPAVSGPSGTTTFKGTTYNRYQIEWSTPHTWTGGSAGQVPGGVRFHVGATFSGVDFSGTPDAIIITDVRLLDSSGNVLAQHPRVPSFDAGTPDAASDALVLGAFAFRGRPMLIQNVVVRQLPRMLSLNAMVAGARMVDLRGMPVRPWKGGVQTVLERATLDTARAMRIRIARLSQRPHVRDSITAKECEIEDRMRGPDVARCHPGLTYDLFPATTLYVTATAIDPMVRHWDRSLRRWVVAPVTTRVYYQIPGRRRSTLKGEIRQ